MSNADALVSQILKNEKYMDPQENLKTITTTFQQHIIISLIGHQDQLIKPMFTLHHLN